MSFPSIKVVATVPSWATTFAIVSTRRLISFVDNHQIHPCRLWCNQACKSVLCLCEQIDSAEKCDSAEWWAREDEIMTDNYFGIDALEAQTHLNYGLINCTRSRRSRRGNLWIIGRFHRRLGSDLTLLLAVLQRYVDLINRRFCAWKRSPLIRFRSSGEFKTIFTASNVRKIN